ncbi:Methanogenesis regulatory histidine kinase FilI [uncultured archaeon]|nr:Methanogenesis regulatory histidine kinase FilI [uncultured archaeon]
MVSHHVHLEELVKERTAELEKRSMELSENQASLLNIVEDLNRTTEELKSANLRLKELDRMKSMFIASTSHELRTPLNSIIGFSSILLEGWSGVLSAEQNEQIQLIHNSGQQLLYLINDVIDISKIEAGKIDVNSTDFRLKEVVDESVAALRNNINDKGLALSVDVPDIIMRTDRRRLRQCLLNYLSNAVKFTENGSILLTAKSINNMIDIYVTDTGIGMREEDIAKLFEPFVRLESPISPQVGGTGLGLYLTKKLVVEVLGGTVGVKSVYGKGSTFSMHIPVKPEAKT